jgi:hypothetical protein
MSVKVLLDGSVCGDPEESSAIITTGGEEEGGEVMCLSVPPVAEAGYL